LNRRSNEDGMDKFQRLPFSVLVKKDKNLSGIRSEYALKSKSERRMAADWEYHSEIAGELLSNAMANAGEYESESSYWPSGITALAIDPLYAPAILTVGSLEYMVGRIEEAMNLFMTLTELSEDEDELNTIIDKAGDFLIDNDDYENALALYAAAEKAYPKDALYLIGSGYCLGKLGRYEDSVEKHRCADSLEPNNYKHLNDFGYSLLEAGRFDEAEQMLKKSISLAPEDYEFPRNNLNELRERRKG
jgi:tetratricopeptide (TPR) repeat protein